MLSISKMIDLESGAFSLMTWKLLQCIMEEFYPVETGQSLTDDLNYNAGPAILVSIPPSKKDPIILPNYVFSNSILERQVLFHIGLR